MVAITAGSTVDSIAIQRPNTMRRGGWLLIAATLAFVAVTGFVSFISGDIERAGKDMAAAVGKSTDDLTMSEQSRVANQYPALWIINDVVTLIPYGIFTLAVYQLRRSLPTASTARLWTAAWAATLAMFALWIFQRVMSLCLLADQDHLPPMVRNGDTLGWPTEQLMAIVGLTASLCMALALRRQQIAPRLSLVIIAITGLLILFGIAVPIVAGEQSLEPDILLYPGFVLGIGLGLATRKAGQPSWQPEASTAQA